MSSSKRPPARAAGLDEVADRLHSAAIHLLRGVRRVDAAAGIGPARASALSVVVFGGPLNLGALAAAEQVTPPTMSRIVAGLEEDGLVRREIDRKDRRSVRLRATPRGVRLMQEGRRRRVAAVAETLQDLTAEDLAVLGRAVAILERLFGGRH